MTDTQESPERDEPPDSILQTIRDEISQALGGLFRDKRADVVDDGDGKAKAGGDPAKPPPVDVEGQVKSAVSAVLEEDKKKTAAETEMQAMKDELAALKALVEKAPEQFRPIEKIWRVP